MYLAVTPCHDAVVLPYAAYLRVYEPLSAFSEPERSRWAAYAVSAGRPHRPKALAAEQADSLRRLIATPPAAAPERESGEAYVRWAEGAPFICPWQTRLRSWLAVARLRASTPPLARAAFPIDGGGAAADDFARWQCTESSLRLHIQASTWLVPFAWFVPFAADERRLRLGAPCDPGDTGRATAAVTRALAYVTVMARARRRVARALSVTRRPGRWPSAGPAVRAPGQLRAGLEDIGRWLEEFHPHALVELDYGGLVHLLDDEALCRDQSVAEVSATVSALAGGEMEFAKAMYRRFTARWRVLESLERAN